MDIVSFDPKRPGVFAFGQEAVGIFAFGQSAYGVVAIGQIARGVFVVGQLAVGFAGVGQAGIFVVAGLTQIGIAGRGRAWCFSVVPKLRRRLPGAWMPDMIESFDELMTKGQGWVAGTVKSGKFRPKFAIAGTVTPSPEAAETIETTEITGKLTNNVAVVGRLEAVIEGTPVDDGGYRDAPGMVTRTRFVLHEVRPKPSASWWPFEADTTDGPVSAGRWVFAVMGVLALLTGWWFGAGQFWPTLFGDGSAS